MTELPYRYRVFGRQIASQLPLSGVDVGTGAADVSILLDAEAGSGAALDGPFGTCFREERRVLEFPTFGRLEEASHRIAVAPEAGADLRIFTLPILGPVMATHLHYAGEAVLHGSALCLEEPEKGVTVLLGDRGAGKSTTAAALIAAGASLVSDDVIAVTSAPEKDPMVATGYPALKLLPDARDRFGAAIEMEDLAIGAPFPKARIGIRRRPLPDHLPLSRICVLRRGEALRFSRLPPDRALAALMRHGYMFKYGPAPFANGRGARMFRDCVRLAGSVPIGELTLPADLGSLERAARDLMSKDGSVFRTSY